MSDRQPIGLAIIGAGWAGNRQAEAIAELGTGLRVAALVDNDPDHLMERARALGVRTTYPDLAAALADPDVAAVSICTPHRAHAGMAIQAAEAGRHVLVEKPMATTVADATRMLEAAKANGVRLYVAENEVYKPHIRFLRELVRSGRYVGELTAAAFVTGYRSPSPSYPGRRSWLTLPEEGGTGTWMLNGVHGMAQLRHVLGEVQSVYVLEHRASSFRRDDLEGTMSGALTLESGLVVWIVNTPETRFPPSRLGFQLYGDRGIVFGHPDGYTVHSDELGGGDEIVRFGYPPERLSSYALEMQAFADFVAGDEGPTDGTSERRTLAVIEAGLESARSGRPVDLAERFGPL